jgi:hypothetical protein
LLSAFRVLARALSVVYGCSRVTNFATVHAQDETHNPGTTRIAVKPIKAGGLYAADSITFDCQNPIW